MADNAGLHVGHFFSFICVDTSSEVIKMAWQKFRAGVTLLELMMVIVILSITAAGVIPLMSLGGASSGLFGGR